MKPVSFSLLGFLKLVRPGNLGIVLLTQYITAIFLAGMASTVWEILKDPKILLLALSSISIASAGYIINDYYDVKIDFINKPQKVVVGKLLKRKFVIISHPILNFAGIAIGFYLSIPIGVIQLTAAILLWWYSNHLQRLPFVGNFTIAILTGASLAIVGILYHNNELLIYVYSLFAFCATLIREVIKDIEDIKGDQDFGLKTLPIIWGIRRTKKFLFVLIGTSILILIPFIPVINLPGLKVYFVILLPAVLYFCYLLFKTDTIKGFHRLSTYMKIIMISGVLSMALVGLN
ncbi:MAG: geranylgeranylglycerol-phosphate geranylgeranyltransferase [Bacteroidetes bacterium]|nr:geranylgeranylglycerol-phosphate geranylgeranyltransferase [Bacteroidota bacterium]